MQLTYEPDAKVMYIRLTDRDDYKVAETIEAAEEVLIDLDKKGHVLGVEILNPSRHTFQFIKKLANKYKIPQLKRLQHPEKMEDVISA